MKEISRQKSGKDDGGGVKGHKNDITNKGWKSSSLINNHLLDMK